MDMKFLAGSALALGVAGVVSAAGHGPAAEEMRQHLQALEEIKVLSGFLPICSSCKKIRDDKGYWNQIETYIRDHSEVQFSHSICPDCARKVRAEIDESLNPEETERRI